MSLIYFNTVNKSKIKEIKLIFKDLKSNLRFLENPITEILSDNLEEVILNKAAQAYKKADVPVIVEHGAIFIDYLQGYPGALSKPMWDLLGERICDLVPKDEKRTAMAASAVCYCDGMKRVHVIESTPGFLSVKGKGKHGFQWDPVFIPLGQKQTYAEMTTKEKLKYSQAAKAYNKLRMKLGF